MSWFLVIYFLALPVAAVCINSPQRKRRIPGLLLFCVTCALCYGALLLSVKARRHELRANVDRFDLNHNGLIDGAELVPAATKAISEASNDTGMNLAPFTGVPYALFWTGVVFLTAAGLSRFRKRMN